MFSYWSLGVPFYEDLTGINRQPPTVNRQMAKKINPQKRNIFTVNRQMSEPK